MALLLWRNAPCTHGPHIPLKLKSCVLVRECMFDAPASSWLIVSWTKYFTDSCSHYYLQQGGKIWHQIIVQNEWLLKWFGTTVSYWDMHRQQRTSSTLLRWTRWESVLRVQLTPMCFTGTQQTSFLTQLWIFPRLWHFRIKACIHAEVSIRRRNKTSKSISRSFQMFN